MRGIGLSRYLHPPTGVTKQLLLDLVAMPERERPGRDEDAESEKRDEAPEILR